MLSYNCTTTETTYTGVPCILLRTHKHMPTHTDKHRNVQHAYIILQIIRYNTYRSVGGWVSGVGWLWVGICHGEPIYALDHEHEP